MGDAGSRSAAEVLPSDHLRAARAGPFDTRMDDLRQGHEQTAPTRSRGEMTMTTDDYIARVLEVLPRTMPLRSQIGMELRGHIAERLTHGLAVDDVLRQLGDPVKLA